MRPPRTLRLLLLGWPLFALSACRSGAPTADDQPLLLFPPPPATPRVQFLTWASGEDQVAEGMSSFDRFLLGEEQRHPRSIVKPYGIAARDGVVYVCDTKGFSLVRLDFKNRKYDTLGTSGLGRLQKPLNVAIDPLGYKFVVDSLRRQVVVFAPNDEYSTAFDLPDPCHPVDLAVHGDEIFVLDNDDTPQVVVLDRETGTVKRMFGSLGIEPGQFKIPNSIAVDADGFVYVSDTLNFRIQKLTPSGDSVWAKGTPGRRLGQFGRPRGVRVGPDGVVYVVEGAMQIVQLFDQEGRSLMSFGGPGNVPGAMVLPSTLAIDDTSIPYFKDYIHEDFDVEYLLFVANQYGQHLVNVYAFGAFPEGYRLSASEIANLPPPDEATGIAPAGDALPPDDDAETSGSTPSGIPNHP